MTVNRAPDAMPGLLPGRGRPVVFGPDAQDTYLGLVAAGVRMGQAAAKAGTSPRTVSHFAHRDPHFAERLAAAKQAGREARIPHGTPGGYDDWSCRCQPCTTASSNARAGRRDRETLTETEPADEAGDVIPLPDQPPGAQVPADGAESPLILLLPKAS